jgi:membrane protease YdiL (CAAX protease family)
MFGRRITFDAGVRTLVWFGAAWVALFAVFIPLETLASGISKEVWYLQELVFFLAIVGVAILLARLDGVGPGELGLSRRHLLPGVLAFAGVYAGLNVLGVSLAAAFGLGWGPGLITETVPEQYLQLPSSWLLFVMLNVLVGIAEEFSVRGYFQNKVIAVLGGESRLRVGLGVLTASVTFGVLHAPGALLTGTSATAVAGIVLSRSVTGVFFGLFYELTRNVYFVALLHALGNTWPLLIDWGDWSGTALYAFFAGGLLLYLGGALGYRYWAEDTDLAPTTERTGAKSPRLAS